MKQLVSISFVLASLVGVAAAQQPAPPAKGSAAPPAAPAGKAAPAAPAAPAGKAAPAAPAAPAGKAAPAAPAAPAAGAPAAPPKPPEVPPELVDAGKKWAGTWKCTGTSTMMEQTIDVKATVVHKVDATLNKFWIQTSFTGTAPKMPKMPPMKGTWYTTYDAANKKLWRVTLNARGGHGTAWGTVTDNKISWEGEARWAGVDVKTRTTEEIVSPKELKVMGESSKDGGKTWAKEVDATCKK